VNIKSHFLLAFFLAAAWTSSLGVGIVSGPTFVPATNAPLAGVLQLTTDLDSRVGVMVHEGTNSWTRDFFDFSRDHSIILAGFKPDRTNHIQVTVYDQAQGTFTAQQPLTFVTAPLPADFPHSIVVNGEPANMEPGYTLFIIQNRTAKKSYVTMMDSYGQVVWYSPAPSISDVDVRQLPNGNLFIEEPTPLNRFLEINLLGQTVKTLPAPTQYPVNNHEGLVTDHGTILYLSDVSQVVSNFPSSVTNPAAPVGTVSVDDNPVVEISATDGTLLHAWPLLDMLDPTRVSYLTYTFQSPYGVDNEHANAVVEDTNDNSIIVSVRTQNAVAKFSRATGQLKWILGPPANWHPKWQPYLLTPVGTPFEWSYGQHAPMLTPQGTLLLYDDGNFRASPFDAPMADAKNWSRAVEYRIDENNMAVAQAWDTTSAVGERLYTGAVGDADWLPQRGNVLVTYGLVSYVNGAHPSLVATNATMVRIREVTHDPVPKIVFDLSFFDSNTTNKSYMGYLCYRSDRVPDLYCHPAMPVADLKATFSSAGALLTFTADPTRTYTLDASGDGSHWTQLGTAQPGQTAGSFQFQDAAGGTATERFYRVVTH
jgi:arylsulfate sulfotransferase